MAKHRRHDSQSNLDARSRRQGRRRPADAAGEKAILREPQLVQAELIGLDRDRNKFLGGSELPSTRPSDLGSDPATW